MFGSSNSRAFKPVPFGQSHRRRKGVPRWLMWLLAGVAAGAFAYYYAEKEWLPPRLSLGESVAIKKERDDAVQARTQAEAGLAQATAKMKAAQQERSDAINNMNLALAKVDPLKKDLDMFLKTLPPDPRGNAVAIRAGLFSASAGKLNYHVLFTRDKATSEPFKGVVKLVVAGSRGGKDSSIDLAPQAVSIDSYQHVTGALPLPEGFQPREVSVKLLKGSGGNLESLRVFRM